MTTVRSNLVVFVARVVEASLWQTTRSLALMWMSARCQAPAVTSAATPGDPTNVFAMPVISLAQTINHAI